MLEGSFKISPGEGADNLWYKTSFLIVSGDRGGGDVKRDKGDGVSGGPATESAQAALGG